MSWKDRCLSFVKKYGKSAKVVAGAVLNVVAPGSGTLVGLVDLAIDQTGDLAQDQWEAALLKATHNNAAELQRLGELFELLVGGLDKLCAQAFANVDKPNDLPRILGEALAADPSLSRVLHHVEAIKQQCAAFQDDLRRIYRNQEEAIPVFNGMNRVVAYFDELWDAGIKPHEFAKLIQLQRAAAAHIARGHTADAEDVLQDLRAASPRSASVCVLEAAAATREHHYPAAQRALTRAVKIRPGDAELIELGRQVTVLATGGATPKKPTPSPAPTADQPRRLQPGDSLDGWHLEACLGGGGWGQVFKGTRDGQTRALKVMHPELAADRAFVDRFMQEATTLLKLPKHPNLVRIDPVGFGYCATHRTRYLQMEYIEGPTLEQYLAAKGKLSEGQVRKVFPDAVAGLAKAHSAGIVHRDIKPGNFIIRKSDQRLVLVDFGLAVGVEEFGQTKVGGISILFAAPEQHYGDPATQASDVFSLCAVIHYALNYDKPDLRKPNKFAPGLVPESLRAALTQGMKPNADERFRDAGQLHAALQPTEKGGQTGQQRIGAVITNSLGMQFAWVPPGESWLGGGGGEPGTTPFTLRQGLWCGAYPVTQAEWQAVMGDTPSHFKGNPRYPVESVSWNRVQEFIEQLNQRTREEGLLYRLPAEEEWEYICRGGPLFKDQSKYHFYFARSKADLTPAPGNDLSSTQANFDGNQPAGSAANGPYLQRPSDVGLYLPNPLEIYDLHGNVWEWTSSAYERGSARVIRGGSWFNYGANCTASDRGRFEPGSAYYYVGVRLLAVPTS